MVGSMGRHRNPQDNAKAQIFLNTFKVEGVFQLEFETLEDVSIQLSR